MKKFFLSLVIIGALALVGGGIIAGVWAAQLAKPEKVIEKPDTTPAVTVQVVEAKRVEDRFYLTGLAEAWEAVTISAEISGQIEWQGIEEGDAVAAGQEILRISTTSIQARLDQARAEHKLSEQELARVRELRDRGISSPQEQDRASANRDAAAARLRLAEIDFAHSVIKPELSGVMDRIYNEAGEFVTVGKPLARVVQIDKLKLLVGIPERDVSRFKPGDTVMVRFDSAPDDTFEAKIFRIATTAEPATRTFRTEIEVANTQCVLKPGMIARVGLVREVFEQGITVPMFSVLSRPEGRFVFVEEDGKAVMRPVEVGFFQDGQVLITRGLGAGDQLISVGQRSLRDGESVRVIPAPATAS